VAEALASAGARVWACDCTDAELDLTTATIANAGGTVRGLRHDLVTADGCRSLVEEIRDEVEQVAVLVNNAGVLHRSSLREMSDEAWSSTIAVNLTAPFLLTRGLLPLIERDGGSVINVSSRAGVAPFAGEAAYCASKFGIEALTGCLALELRDRPVSANTVTPGLRIKPTGLTDAEAAQSGEAQRRQWSDAAVITPAFTFLARLEGEVSGRRFDALRLSEELRELGGAVELARLEELAE
jgi:NAD(P)-dependent dehydrogenase (short-subunit alcohol dehydrogenase family)